MTSIVADECIDARVRMVRSHWRSVFGALLFAAATTGGAVSTASAQEACWEFPTKDNAINYCVYLITVGYLRGAYTTDGTKSDGQYAAWCCGVPLVSAVPPKRDASAEALPEEQRQSSD